MTDSTSAGDCSVVTEATPTPEWIEHGGFVLLIAGVIAIFWGMAFICEEYCVPSISVFCKRNKISEDIAGAIFIGTGLSLPVLFASFVGLFVSNTAIGVGTVVGGDIFNNLMNIAISIYVAPGQELKLDGVVFTREMIFYLISCLFVIWSVHEDLFDSLRTAFSHEQWVSCLSIPWQSSFVLIASYFVYCLIEAYFDKISLFFRPAISRICCLENRNYSLAPAPEIEDIVDVVTNNYLDLECQSIPDPFFLSFDIYPQESRNRNYNNDYYNSMDGNQTSPTESSNSSCREEEKDGSGSVSYSTLRDISQGNRPRFTLIPTYTDPPLPHHQYMQQHDSSATNSQYQHLHHVNPSLYISEADVLNNFMMFLRSNFYTVHDFGCVPTSRKWKLRYFRFTDAGIYYKLEYHLSFQGEHVRYIDLFDLEKITIEHPEWFEFSIQLHSCKKKYYFRAPNELVYDTVLKRLYRFHADNREKSDAQLRDLALKAIGDICSDIDKIVQPDSESIGDTMFTAPDKLLLKLFYYFTLPVKLLLYFTIPDVRRQGSEQKALLSIGSSFLWLALFTYLLVEILSIMAKLVGINDVVMGMTIGAWATSYPAVWSSVVVARSGYGNVAVCNALGSIVFSNFLGLGLPWFVYSMVYKKPYSGLQDQGVAFSILVLMMISVGTYLTVAFNRFNLSSWMIPLFTSVYIGFVAYFSYFILTLEIGEVWTCYPPLHKHPNC